MTKPRGEALPSHGCEKCRTSAGLALRINYDLADRNRAAGQLRCVDTGRVESQLDCYRLHHGIDGVAVVDQLLVFWPLLGVEPQIHCVELLDDAGPEELAHDAKFASKSKEPILIELLAATNLARRDNTVEQLDGLVGEDSRPVFPDDLADLGDGVSDVATGTGEIGFVLRLGERDLCLLLGVHAIAVVGSSCQELDEAVQTLQQVLTVFDSLWHHGHLLIVEERCYAISCFVKINI
jgi:hypothetical protein